MTSKPVRGRPQLDPKVARWFVLRKLEAPIHARTLI